MTTETDRSVPRSSAPGHEATVPLVAPSRHRPAPAPRSPVVGLQRWGIRIRLALTAVVVVLAAMVMGGAGLILLLEDNLETTTTRAAAERAVAVADSISSLGLSEAVETVIAAPRGGQIVQIIAPDRTVFSSSSARHQASPLAATYPAAGRTIFAEVTALQGEDGEWAVAARGVSARDKTFVVQVGVPIGVGRDVVRTVVRYLLIATPLLLGTVALVVWLLIGRALSTVDRIRATVSRIDGQQLSTRVDVPPSRDEIAALATTMNAMLDRLESSDSAQRAFVSDASHELRSPLATLIAAAELAETSQGDRRDRLMSTIRAEARRLQSLVEDLMALARAEGARPAVLGDVDLDDIVEHERYRLQTTVGCRVEAYAEPARLVGDPAAISRLVRNLTDNAARHAESTVRIRLTRSMSEAVLWIDNDGAVIDGRNREKIFERFVRLDESRSRDAGGSGLGLAIARGVARSYGGTLQVVDAADGWCRFELRLPVPREL